MQYRPTVKKVEYDGIIFDSVDEVRYYKLLKIREDNNEVNDIRIHISYELQPAYKNNAGKNIKCITYSADFVYYDLIQKRYRAVDVKGFADEKFKLKKKIFEYKYCYGSLARFKELEVLVYRKSLDGFVSTDEVKKLMRNYRERIISEKNEYKMKYEKLASTIEKKEKLKNKLKEKIELLESKPLLTKTEHIKLLECKEKLKDLLN